MQVISENFNAHTGIVHWCQVDIELFYIKLIINLIKILETKLSIALQTSITTQAYFPRKLCLATAEEE